MTTDQDDGEYVPGELITASKSDAADGDSSIISDLDDLEDLAEVTRKDPIITKYSNNNKVKPALTKKPRKFVKMN